MDVQDHTSPSGHESHGVHLCRRCGWPFPNLHPSARHRRSHKKICGTIEGYTNLIDSGVVSDDEYHPDDDTEKTPSPKADEATSAVPGGGGGGIRGSFSRSEDDLFSDAVTEFSDSGTSAGSANKSLERDLFFSFKDAENGGTIEVSNAPIEISKVDTTIELSEKIDTHVEKIEETDIKTVCDSSESNIELIETDVLVKDEVVEAGEEKGQKSQTSEVFTEEDKDLEMSKTPPEVSAIIGGYDANVKQENLEKLEPATTDGISDEIKQEIGSGCEHDLEVKESKTVQGAEGISEEIKIEKFESATADEISEEIKQEIESDCEHVSEEVKKSETVEGAKGISEEFKHDKIELDHKLSPQIVNESEIDHLWVVSEEIKHEKFESDHDRAPEVSEESKTDHSVSVLNKKEDLDAPNTQIREIIKETVPVLTEKEDLGPPELVKSSKEQNQDVKEPGTILNETEVLVMPDLEESSKEQFQEVVKEIDTVLTEKEDLGAPELEKSSKEQTQKVVKEPDTASTEKEDLGASEWEKSAKEQIQEVVKEPSSSFTDKEDLGAPELEKSSKDQIQKLVKEPDTTSSEKEDLGASELEKSSKEQIEEVVTEPSSSSTEKEDLGAPNLEKSLKEEIQEVVKEPNPVLTEISAPNLKKQSNEQTHEVFENPDSILTEKQDLGAPELEKRSKENVVQEADLVFTESEDPGAPKSGKNPKENAHEVIIEQEVDNVSNVVGDVGIKKITSKDPSDSSISNSKNSSGVVPEPAGEEGNGKLMNNQESGAALSVDSGSRNSLEGNWGSVSVLSTASMDAETLHSTEKSKVNSGKSVAADSHSGAADVFEPPSFMTLVEPEGEDQKPGSSEVKDSKQPPNPKAGWFPTLTKVNNESEGRKKNEEAIAKVTNWTPGTGRQSTPLKNLLGEAKSPNAKQPEAVVEKNEADNEKPGEDAVVNPDISSPPKLIDDGKKGGKKVKGRSSWVPFVCCSSVNVVN